MARLPFIGRLTLNDYARILFTYLFFFLEMIARGVLALFSPITGLLDWLRSLVIGKNQRVFTGFKDAPLHPIANMPHTADIVTYRGYPFEEHVHQTSDGFLLALYRIPHGKNQAKTKRNKQGKGKPPVLLWHGFMMNSEVWVCQPEEQNSLAFQLAEQGYDVWLANSRGNKYSCKHVQHTPQQDRYWKFGLDELVMIDVPETVDYVLECTGFSSLTYIGFSQGTGICFGALSMSPSLNRKIQAFIALAPATKPNGLESRLVDSFARMSPELVYLIFGRRVLLSMSIFWKDLLSPSMFRKVIDASVWILFKWTGESMSINNRMTVYPHLYSYTSVQLVVHWFQIIGTGRFAMYDENPVLGGASLKGQVPPPFPCSQITAPLYIFYGGRDNLCDIPYLLEQTRSATEQVMEIETYEHLSFLWADDVRARVNNHVLDIVNESTGMNSHQEKVPQSPQILRAEKDGIRMWKDIADEALHVGTSRDMQPSPVTAFNTTSGHVSNTYIQSEPNQSYSKRRPVPSTILSPQPLSPTANPSSSSSV